MENGDGFWGDGFWGDAFLPFLQLSALGLVLAVCAVGVALIVLVALNEWRLYRRGRDKPTWVSSAIGATVVLPENWVVVNMPDPKDKPVVFDWDWPAA
jgi:hypothetical protein